MIYMVESMYLYLQLEDGLKVKLGVFVPQATPKEIEEGHKYHLAVEFNNSLHYIAEIFSK